MREVLREAITLGGSSISDYVDADGEEGFFQLQHRVYGREGEPCLVCGTAIRRDCAVGPQQSLLPKMSEIALIERFNIDESDTRPVKKGRVLTRSRDGLSELVIVQSSLRIHSMNKFSIGVDLGGTNLRIAAVDEQGTLVEKVTLGTKVSLGRDHVIDDMCDAIQRMSEKYKDTAPLMGIGIGVPGIIDMQTGLVRESPNLPDWVDYPVRADIEQRLKTVVILENDANVAALGEKWLGAAKDFDDVAMLTLGTGVGGGLVLGGTIWRGANGMAGEFGHTTVEPDGHPCGCGNHGCLEQYASATAVVRMAREAIARQQRLGAGARRAFRRGVQREVDLQSRHPGR